MRDVLGCAGNYDQYSQGWPLDLKKSHELLLINSWSKFAIFDGDDTAVFYPTGLNEVYDQNYIIKTGTNPDNLNLLKTIELNSQFLR